MASKDWGTYRRLLGFVKKYWVPLVASFGGFLIAAGAEAVFVKLFGDLIDNWSITASQYGYSIPLLLFGVAFIRALGTVFGEVLISRASVGVVYDIRQRLFNHTLRMPSDYYDTSSQGHIVSRITFTVAQLRDAGTDALKTIIQDGIKVFVYFGAMLWMNWQLTLIFIATAPLLALIVYLASSRFRQISKRIQNSMGDVTHVVSESVSGYRVVRTFGGETYERDRFERHNRTNRQQNMKMAVTKVTSAQLNETIVVSAICGMILALLLDPSGVTSGQGVTFLGMAALLTRPIRKLSEVNAKLQRGIAAAEDVFGQLDHPLEPDEVNRELSVSGGEIAFDNLSFEYEADKPVLQNIDLTIGAGETVALVGRSGSGKTTLASLIPRFYSAQQGQIRIDGQNIADVSLASLRKNIALVSQNVTLFNDTLRNNIAYGDLVDASDEEIKQAIEQANATDFIAELASGLDTMVGDNGVLLSGGQRQRIAIARALLKDAPILILDEATSALDNESERHIQNALETVMTGRTTVVIAHRLSTIENADRILVIDQGSIVEQGSHEDLLASSGVYAELVKAQFEGSASKQKVKQPKAEPKLKARGMPSNEAFEKSALGLSRAWYQGAWWLHLLRPLSGLYDVLRKRRKRKLTVSGSPGRTRLPVIVVGNITVGGTGKTPLVGWLVESLRALGYSPGIVLRGYGGAFSKDGTLIPAAADPERYSDEGVQMRDRLNCPIAMCADRVKGLRILETQACDIAISDDGLQHYNMARDVEICVVDGSRGIGNGFLLPAGPLREPVERLDEVDWVVANGEPSNLIDEETVMRLVPDGFIHVQSNEWLDMDSFVQRHAKVHAVCGIGNPARFFQTLRDLDITALQHVYRDHHEFEGHEVEFEDDLAVVCTEKDAAKLRNLEKEMPNVWYLRVNVAMPDDALERLSELLSARAILPQREMIET